MTNSKRHRYTVSELTELIRLNLESEFHDITLEGEISNFRPSSTGHFYFTLKDKDAVISAVMFKNRINELTFTPEDGQFVIVEGGISVYAKRGTYQIICEKMEKAGIGNILAMLEERKRKLAAEGLFDEKRKKLLPLFPSRVAVVTSPTGAVIRDILKVLKRRNSNIHLVILPAPVQGEEAGPLIAAQIRRTNMFGLADVIIIGRGGGSLEDLLPFSAEEVVRAIAESKIPVISAVGHEIDIVLSDLAADVRAPTPSAAAEIVSSTRDDLIEQISELQEILITCLRQRIEKITLLLKQFSAEQLERNFRILLQPFLLRLDDAKETMVEGLKSYLTEIRHTLELLKQSIAANSPLEILKKGYALVTDKITGALINSALMVKTGQFIGIRFVKGNIGAEVKEIET
ncbi:MAG: exodeoxyribonuclease VII large subunit [Spirochaetota bacterium]